MKAEFVVTAAMFLAVITSAVQDSLAQFGDLNR